MNLINLKLQKSNYRILQTIVFGYDTNFGKLTLYYYIYNSNFYYNNIYFKSLYNNQKIIYRELSLLIITTKNSQQNEKRFS
jgi:hypothetical protein